jgi:hypothetical protein
MKKQLLIESIRTDGGTQSRAEIHQDTVAEYVEAIQAGSKMPPLLVFHDGTDYWLAEGFHRLLAHQQAGKRNVLCEIKQGTKEDAAWASAGANVTHGLRRTNADKRKATEMAIRLRPDMNDVSLANHCGVHPNHVAAVRRSLEATSQIVRSDTRVRSDGTRFKMPSAPPTRPTSAPPTPPPTTPPTPPAPPPVRTPSAPPTPSAPAPLTPAAQPTPPARRPGPQTGQADATGHPIPDHLIGLWDRRVEVEDLLAHLSKVRCAVQAAQDAADPLFAELNTSAAMANLNTAYDALKATAPHAVCPWCHGALSDQCRGCKGRGMIGRFAWGLVPAELKKARQ